jgi:para-nitrobenzyl esterase
LSAFTKVNSNVIPSVDAKVLPQTIKATFVAGKNNRVPLINGSNENENDMFVAIGEMTARFAAKPPNFDPANRSFVMSPEAYAKGAADLAVQSGHSVEDIKTKYYPLSAHGSDPVMQPSLAAGVAGTDSIFSCNGINVSSRVAGQGSPVWMYEYRNQSAPPLVGSFGGKYMLTYKQGAAHAAELPYLFNMLPIGGAEQTALKEAMTGYWTNFARTGTPNGKGVPQWSTYKTGKIQALDVADAGGVKAMPAKAFRTQHQCDGAWVNLTF